MLEVSDDPRNPSVQIISTRSNTSYCEAPVLISLCPKLIALTSKSVEVLSKKQNHLHQTVDQDVKDSSKNKFIQPYNYLATTPHPPEEPIQHMLILPAWGSCRAPAAGHGSNLVGSGEESLLIMGNHTAISVSQLTSDHL